MRRHRAGFAIQHGQQTLGATVTDTEQASHLGVPAGTTLIASRRLYPDHTDRPLIVVAYIVHPANYGLAVDLVPNFAPLPQPNRHPQCASQLRRPFKARAS